MSVELTKPRNIRLVAPLLRAAAVHLHQHFRVCSYGRRQNGGDGRHRR